MSAIDYCINKVMNSDIPRAILKDVFIDERAQRYRLPSSIEDGIRNKIMKAIVIPELSTMGGTQVAIDIQSIPYSDLNNNERIYQIPLTSTQGREITRLEYICTSTFSGSTGNEGIITDVEKLMRNQSPMKEEMNGEVTLLANNNILINNPLYVLSNVFLVCLLELDPHLTTIKPAYYNPLSKLVIAATKAYIFRETVLEMDRAKLYDGREFGSYKDIVSNWSDMYETYEDLLVKWRKYLILNDPQLKEAHVLRAGKWRV